MEKQVYDKARILQKRIVDLNQAINILSGNVFDLQEVNLVLTGNNINFRVKIEQEQLPDIVNLLESELNEKEAEFENL